MTTNDFLDGIDDVDQAHLDELAVKYPIIQWINGKPTNKKAADASYEGGWFIPDTYVTAEGMGEGWVKHELIHKKGATWGWASNHLTVALIRNRRSWVYVDEDEHITYLPWDWDVWREWTAKGEKLIGKLHTLVAIRGWQKPFVLTTSGNASKSLEQCCLLLQQNVIVPANNLLSKEVREKGKRWPFRAFWLTIGPKKTDKGEPVFSEVGSKDTSIITLIYGNVPDKPETKEQIGSRFVGRETLKQLETWYNEADAWARQWDKQQTGTDEEHTNGTGEAEATAEPAAAMNF